MRRLACLCLLGVLGFLTVLPRAARSEDAADGEAFEKGKLIAAVKTKDDPKQTYALYLPKAYDPAKKWPILYAFSPNARGTDPVRLFQETAERYGWIVAGSNNSQNGPHEPIVKALAAIWKDTRARLSIDDKRLYATGFSGGARVGFHLALEKEETEKIPFAGVIPCGAAFPSSNQLPKKDSALLVCGVVGETCFNHGELLRMDQTLRTLNVRHRVLVFNGGHEWPPAAYCALAARYMQLHALCAAARAAKPSPEADAELTALLAEETAEAEALLDKPATFFDGYRRIKEWAAACQGLAQGEALAKKAAELEAGEQYKKDTAAYAALDKLREDLGKIKDDNEQFKETVNRLTAFITEHPDTFACEHVKVQLNELPRRMAQGGVMLLQQKNYEAAVMYLNRAKLLMPEDPNVPFYLAMGLAQTQKLDEACASLAEAVKLGFKDRKQIEQGKLFDPIKDMDAFKKVLAELQGGPAEKTEDTAKTE
ncbi:MAG: hypothetical protein L6R28_11820 [Planctomycetes bacterium]|nr:hypothetical protein [Planctomycetota bacterium]